ncbi:hypothetical protein GGI12_002401 [Dipsacomyces acuminosporus]|nr:hypothetical protein GGI12_002401 [Dipsacomyces acuminosporus]
MERLPPPRVPFSGKATKKHGFGKNPVIGSSSQRHHASSGGKNISPPAASNAVGEDDTDSESCSEESSDDEHGNGRRNGNVDSGHHASFPVKPRGVKGGRRAPGQRSMLGSASDEEVLGELKRGEDPFDFPRGGIIGPRQVYCVCRRGIISGQQMISCTDCKELFHGQCVNVADSIVGQQPAPLYVCRVCLEQHPRKKRAPGTILGTGEKIAHVEQHPRSKKTASAAASSQRSGSHATHSKQGSDIIYINPKPGRTASADPKAQAEIETKGILPAANQAALAAFMSAAGDMDDDDICPICEDECTCGNSKVSVAGTGFIAEDTSVPKSGWSPVSQQLQSMQVSGNGDTAYGNGNGDNDGDDGDDDDDDGEGGFGLLGAENDHSPARRESAKRKSRKSETCKPTKTKTKAKSKTKAKPKAKKGKGSERNLISRLVNAMGSGGNPAAEDEDIGDGDMVEEELFSAEALPPLDGDASLSSSDGDDLDDSAFVSTAQFNRQRNSERMQPDSKRIQPGSKQAKAAINSQVSLYEPESIIPSTDAAAANGQSEKKSKSKAKTAKASRLPKKPNTKSTSTNAPGSWRSSNKRSQAGSFATTAADEPVIYEVDAAVIRGRNKQPSVLAAIEATDEDEFINITDVTSDMSAGFPSETEFDLPDSKGEELARRAEWSDSNMLGDDDNIEQEEEEYLRNMRDEDFSSSSLSDLDEERLAGIRRRMIDGGNSALDSGSESDTESSDGENGTHSRRRSRARRRYSSGDGVSDTDSLSDIGSIGSLSTNGTDDESDQELTFREARTDEERALIEYHEPGDEREDALLEMHLAQLRAVRNVIEGCSSPLLAHNSISDSDSGSDVVDREMSFTYNPHDHAGDESEGLSDDLMEGWGSDARMRWEVESDSSNSSSLSESKMDKLRLKDEDDNHSDLYSSDSGDSYSEFYTRSAFLDGASDDPEPLEDALYPDGLDIDSASLALGVALSMEQQGYSKEDAVAAAAVAAAAYPGASADNAASGILSKPRSTTTITASMNAHGEADPIDGIVSIKSSNAGTSGSRTGFMSPSRLPTGAHTPFVAPGWSTAAAAAAAYLGSSNPPAVPYVLPKDLNEARSPNVAAGIQRNGSSSLGHPANAGSNSEANEQSSTAADNASADSEQERDAYKSASPSSVIAASAKDRRNDEASQSPKLASTPSMHSSSIFSTQLPNSSFYKPLSSICTPIKRTASSSTVPASQEGKAEEASSAPSKEPASTKSDTGASTASAQSTSISTTSLVAGIPQASLAEVDAALTVLAEQVSTSVASPGAMSSSGSGEQSGNALKRKVSDADAIGLLKSDGEDKRLRSNSDNSLGGLINESAAPVDFSAFFVNSSAPSGASPSASLAATPQRSIGMFGFSAANEEGAEDDWLLTMDQLVDTDALLIKSPPPSPADGAEMAISASDISQHLSSIAEGSGNPSTDPFARWDRIPVNIFRRSRALASSHRRDIMSQENILGAMPSLALTAIKSSRQRRALVNTTLLAQHTLPAEGARHAPKGRRSVRSSGSSHPRLVANVPPPPPPTPLGSLVANAIQASSTAPLQAIQNRKISHSVSGQPSNSPHLTAAGAGPMPKLARADSRHERHKQLASNGIVTEPGTPWDSSSQISDNSENNAAARSSAIESPRSRRRSDAGGGNSAEYAFGWLENEEDLALFSMPELTPGGNGNSSRNPAAMVLASASPMLMPFRTDALQSAASGSDVGSDSHFTL